MTGVVIVGVGEIADRPTDLADGLDPIGLMSVAATKACEDAGVTRDVIDAVDIVHQISWRYDDTAQRFCERFGIDPAQAKYHPGGGESPVKLIHEAALAIERGESRVSLVVGGEARNTAAKARRSGVDLPWPDRARVMEHPWAVEDKLHPLAIAHGVAQPTYVYPFYENARISALGLPPELEHRRSADLWAGFARVAVDNAFGWARSAPSAEEIATPSDRNPWIAYPYTRLMVANPTVNQAAAVLLMDAAHALSLGISPKAMIHVLGGAAADEPADFLARDGYAASPAQDAVLRSASRLAPDGFAETELYSCFPCVPKMAASVLGLPDHAVPTVTGGLTFFGGPFSDYMGHATAAMVRRLRDVGGAGLLYGQGDFVTKHHAVVLSNSAAAGPLDQSYRVDHVADAARGAIPEIVTDAAGDAMLETFTVIFDRTGAPEKGVAVLRLLDGKRTMARIRGDDQETLGRLMAPKRSPVGSIGKVVQAADGLLEWSVA